MSVSSFTRGVELRAGDLVVETQHHPIFANLALIGRDALMTDDIRLPADMAVSAGERVYLSQPTATSWALNISRFVPSDAFVLGRIDAAGTGFDALVSVHPALSLITTGSGASKKTLLRLDKGHVISTAQPGIEAGDKLVSIENITGSRHDDMLIGDGGDNILTGGAGHDRLHGGAGKDTLHGGAGRDVMHGGAGADIFDVGADAARRVNRADQILDFIKGDKIRLGQNVDRLYAVHGKDASGANITILYGTNAAGALNASAVLAVIYNHIDLVAADFDWQLSGGRSGEVVSGVPPLLSGSAITLYTQFDGSADLTRSNFNIAQQVRTLSPDGKSLRLVLGSKTDGTGDLPNWLSFNASTGLITLDTSKITSRQAGNNDFYLRLEELKPDGTVGFRAENVIKVTVAIGKTITLTGRESDTPGVTVSTSEQTDASDIIYGSNRTDREEIFESSAGADRYDGRGHSTYSQYISRYLNGDRMDYVNSPAGVEVFANIRIDGKLIAGKGGHATGDTLTNIEYIRGSNHDDIIGATPGITHLDGRGGTDTLSYRYATEAHLINPYQTHRILSGSLDQNGIIYSSFEKIEGSPFHDVFITGSGRDIYIGGGGQDWVRYDTQLPRKAGAVAALHVDLSQSAQTASLAASRLILARQDFTLTLTGDSATTLGSAPVVKLTHNGDGTVIGGVGTGSSLYLVYQPATTSWVVRFGDTPNIEGATLIMPLAKLNGNLASNGAQFGFDSTLSDSSRVAIRLESAQAVGGKYTRSYQITVREMDEAISNPAAGDGFSQIENILATDGNDTLIGDGADNIFRVLDGFDTIDGGAGLDSVDLRGKAVPVTDSVLRQPRHHLCHPLQSA